MSWNGSGGFAVIPFGFAIQQFDQLLELAHCDAYIGTVGKNTIGYHVVVVTALVTQLLQALFRDGLFLLTVVPLIDGSNAFSCTRLSPFPYFC